MMESMQAMVKVMGRQKQSSAFVQMFISWAMLWHQHHLVTWAVHDKQDT